MKIEAQDVDQLDDATLKRLVLAIEEQLSDEQPDRAAPFWRSLQRALVEAIQERRRAWLLLEAELLDVHDSGGIVGPNDDPVGDALRELRGDQ